MKKLAFLALFLLLTALLSVGIAAEDTVYVGGTDSAYSTLSDAVAALPNGGNIVIAGDTAISAATVLPNTAGVLHVSATNGAVLSLGARLTLGGETVFDDITIHNSAASSMFIVAANHPVTFEDGVVCTSASGGIVYPSVVGGAYSAASSGGSHITVKGGTWRNIYGGNYNGAFTGDSVVDFTGGTVLLTLCGGSYSGNFIGNATVNMGGNAVMEYNTVGNSAVGLIGAEVGVANGTARTFTGNVDINIGGNAVVYANIIGGTRNSNVTVKGDITVDIYGNANVCRHIYGGSYSGNITTGSGGIAVTVRDNVKFTQPTAASTTVCAGCQSGTVTGNVKVVVDADTTIPGNVYGGGYTGVVTGNSHAELRRGTVNVNFTAQSRTGSVSGTVTNLINSGKVGGEVRGDVTVDLAAGASATIGSCTGTVSTRVPDGYALVTTESDGATTYLAKETVSEAPTVVYVDGSGKTEGAYTSLETAVAALTNGGTVVVAGDVDIASATTLPKTPAITITSVFGGEDYTDTAEINFYANLTLGGETVFKDIVLEREKLTSGNIFIVANGNALTVDEGVICLNYTAQQWLSIVGGTSSTAYTGDTHITVKSGYFRNIYGGNYNATFKGNTYVTMTGGCVDFSVIGGNYWGDFEGDTHITFGGEAALIYGAASPVGLVGGSLGVTDGAARTHKGNVYITLKDNCAFGSNIYGASYCNNITHTGDVEITISDNAYGYYSLYAGTRAATLNGNTKVTVNGGDMQGSLFGGCFSGTMNGNAEILINGGELCYYATGNPASTSGDVGTKNVYGGGEASSVLNGNTSVTMHGGSVYGSLFGGGTDATATVGGTKTVTLTGGRVFGALTDATVTVDLSGGGSAEIMQDTAIDTLIGGGTLTVGGGTELAVGKMRGKTEFVINGVPLPKSYITVTEAEEGAAISYTAQKTEALVHTDGVYAIDFEGACKAVKVTVSFNEGCSVTMRVGAPLSGSNTVKADESTATSATYTLAPGLYNAKVYYSATNYQQKYLYVYGDRAEQTMDMRFDAAKGEGFERTNATKHNDEIYDIYYDSSDIEGYFTPDTPYFVKRNGSTVFTTAEEANEFVREKDAACDYMYSFVMDVTEPYGFELPVAVFTKDAIPAGATLEEIAEIVGKQSGRDIIQISCGIHGNEPSGLDGGLAFISEMCGEYGNSVFDGTNIGAVIVFPMMSPDTSYMHVRNTNEEVINPNPNRDYFSLDLEGNAAYAYAAQLFKPTMVVDLHECNGYPNYSDSEILTDIYDLGMNYLAPLHDDLLDAKAALYGDRRIAYEAYGETLNRAAMDTLIEQGIRPYYYYKMRVPGSAQNYGASFGTFTFIIEVAAFEQANQNYDRHVFLYVAGLKSLIGTCIGEDGRMAAEVEAARANSTLSAQIYDDREPIVLGHARSRSSLYKFVWDNPLIAADGTVRVGDNTASWDAYEIAFRYRTQPTAYVVGADAESIGKVLSILDKHGINYYSLDTKTTLTLQQYGGTVGTATLSEKRDVTFENGAYIIPVDGYMADAISILFEPDNPDMTEGYCTFAQMGLLEVADIYRSTESFIAAKLGLSGTYKALEIPAGKTVLAAEVDGVQYGSVNTEGDKAFVVASDKEYYTATLTFTDGTAQTYTVGTLRGDFNGDGKIGVADVMLLLRGILNETADLDGDMNEDGKVTLVDVVRLLKAITE